MNFIIILVMFIISPIAIAILIKVDRKRLSKKRKIYEEAMKNLHNIAKE